MLLTVYLTGLCREPVSFEVRKLQAGPSSVVALNSGLSQCLDHSGDCAAWVFTVECVQMKLGACGMLPLAGPKPNRPRSYILTLLGELTTNFICFSCMFSQAAPNRE